MGVNSISSGSPHVRPTRALSTCGEPDDIKKNTHPKNITALFRVQALPNSAYHMNLQQSRFTLSAAFSDKLEKRYKEEKRQALAN